MSPFTSNDSRARNLRVGSIHPAKLKSEAGQPVAHCANTEDHHIHHHGVGNVLVARKTSFHQSKARLHEEHQKAADDHPHNIDAEGDIRDFFRWRRAILRKSGGDEYKCQNHHQWQNPYPTFLYVVHFSRSLKL
jgi:hypothetical protein